MAAKKKKGVQLNVGGGNDIAGRGVQKGHDPKDQAEGLKNGRVI